MIHGSWSVEVFVMTEESELHQRTVDIQIPSQSATVALTIN